MVKIHNVTDGYQGSGILASDSGQIRGYFNPAQACAGVHQVVFKCHEVSDTINVIVNDSNCKNGEAVSVTNDQQEDFKCFPNPTGNILHLEGVEEANQIFVTDVSGKVVLKSNLKSFSVAHLTRGIYFVHVDKRVIKVIKK